MANIRSLKKDINYVSSELVIECFTYNFSIPEKNQDELASIIADSINMKQNLVQQINEAKKNAKTPLSQQMKTVRKNFHEQVEGLVGRIASISK